MKTWQYYKDITFTFIKIFDIKLASWINETGNFLQLANDLYFAKFCRQINVAFAPGHMKNFR